MKIAFEFVFYFGAMTDENESAQLDAISDEWTQS